MQDSDEQIQTLCDKWWDTRNIAKNQALFREGGKFHKPKIDNLLCYWLYEIDSFLNTSFTFTDKDGEKKEFKPSELDEKLKERLISQLACGIGLFYRDFLGIYKKYKKTIVI